MSWLAMALFLPPPPAAADTFSWGDSGLHGTYLAQMKVTDDDPDHAGDSTATLTCDPGSATRPFATGGIDAVYDTTTSTGKPDYSGGLWSLSSANDILSTMQAYDLNL